ncbi:MAG TPA: DUF4202 domain-containing protein [Chryseosolibacter sp.]|nr:DUF4202 domain-containing protein [Chryseosolibacter sp.]
MTFSPRFQCALSAFDAYNESDPNVEEFNGEKFPKEVLYAQRMTERLASYAPDAPEELHLAVRCQHIGRWEIGRKTFPDDRKGYLQWRSKLALHHSAIAGRIMQECGYDHDMIGKVQFLLQKKQLLQHHPLTQTLEDVICLVFIEYYLEDFAGAHDDAKVIDILKKTIRKMSSRALEHAQRLSLTPRVSTLVGAALA